MPNGTTSTFDDDHHGVELQQRSVAFAYAQNECRFEQRRRAHEAQLIALQRSNELVALRFVEQNGDDRRAVENHGQVGSPCSS